MSEPADKNQPNRFVEALAKALAPSCEAVTVADKDGIILTANDEVERVYRRSKDSVIGRHPLTFCPKDFSLKFSKQIFDTIRASGAWDGVVVNVDSARRRFPILLRTVRVDFGSGSYIISWAKPFPEKAPFSLSRKQAQCFKLLGQGKTPKEIAGELNISVSSVSTHLNRIKIAIAKAQGGVVADIGHLAIRCHEAGWNPMMQINAPFARKTKQ
jgi:DNA-binding CsgD family transcriptional regulator